MPPYIPAPTKTIAFPLRIGPLPPRPHTARTLLQGGLTKLDKSKKLLYPRALLQGGWKISKHSLTNRSTHHFRRTQISSGPIQNRITAIDNTASVFVPEPRNGVRSVHCKHEPQKRNCFLDALRREIREKYAPNNKRHAKNPKNGKPPHDAASSSSSATLTRTISLRYAEPHPVDTTISVAAATPPPLADTTISLAAATVSVSAFVPPAPSSCRSRLRKSSYTASVFVPEPSKGSLRFVPFPASPDLTTPSKSSSVSKTCVSKSREHGVSREWAQSRASFQSRVHVSSPAKAGAHVGGAFATCVVLRTIDDSPGGTGSKAVLLVFYPA